MWRLDDKLHRLGGRSTDISERASSGRFEILAMISSLFARNSLGTFNVTKYHELRGDDCLLAQILKCEVASISNKARHVRIIFYSQFDHF